MNLNSKDFSYHLSKENIALYPEQQRGHSKLLMYKKGIISHHRFYNIPELLPPNSTLFFNDTKVVAARLHFQKETGAQIEILLLNPLENEKPVHQIMQTTHAVKWKCAIKNIKKWKEGSSIRQVQQGFILEAWLIDKKRRTVEFCWQPNDIHFAHVIDKVGCTPLPPYFHRQADEIDKTRYQTLYARYEGAVAAPTAGLHFSDEIIAQLKSHNIMTEFLTLHVGGGTFQPIRTKNAFQHDMHSEQILITKNVLESLLIPQREIIAVGTTSMRALESIYWLGVNIIRNKKPIFYIEQSAPYHTAFTNLPSAQDALEAVYELFSSHDPLIFHTSIFIVPGYSFQLCKGLITNFHLPESTLILLLAAFVGKEWRTIYETALDSDYKFLSYGDSSLLLA